MAQVGHGSITITDLTDTLNTQHFWWTAEGETTGLPGGAYITEIPIKEFKASPSGGYILTRSNGVWLRNGLLNLASFTAGGLAFYNPIGEVVAKVDSGGFNIEDGAIVFEGDFVEVTTTGLDVNPSQYYWYERKERYIPFDVPEEENPHELELYELISGQYVLTEDTSVIDGKIYYKKNIKYILTSDITINSGKTYYRASSGCITLADYGFNREINEALQQNLRFAIGDNFAVDTTGVLYAHGAVLTGEVTIEDSLSISATAANTILDISGATELIDELNQNIDNLGGSLESIEALTATVVDQQGQLLGSMTFGTEDGEPALQIKASKDSTSSVKITNTELQFLEGDNKVASVSNQALEITDATILNKLQFGAFAFIPRENGNLSLKYIGE